MVILVNDDVDWERRRGSCQSWVCESNGENKSWGGYAMGLFGLDLMGFVMGWRKGLAPHTRENFIMFSVVLFDGKYGIFIIFIRTFDNFNVYIYGLYERVIQRMCVKAALNSH